MHKKKLKPLGNATKWIALFVAINSALLLLKNTLQLSSYGNYNNLVHHHQTDDDASHDRRRMIFFCHCVVADQGAIRYASESIAEELDIYSAFSIAIQRIPHLMNNEITTHIFSFKKGMNITNYQPSCEDKIENILQLEEKPDTTMVEIFYHSSFNNNCYTPRNIYMSTNHHHNNPRDIDNNWKGGSHLVNKKELSIRTVNDWGEVFHSKHHNCIPTDQSTLHVYRSKGITNTQATNCNVLHVPTIIRWANAIRHAREEHDHNNETLKDMLTHQLSYDEAKQELEEKTKFCGLITFTTWQVFYSVDALIRHALCRLLTKHYKKCDAFSDWKGSIPKDYPQTHPTNTYKIQKEYKFLIAMANEMSDGYLVEKTVHPYLANSIAISGTPNLGQYINGNRPIVCSIPNEALDHVAQWNRGNEGWMPFNTTPNMWKDNNDNGNTIQPIFHDPYAKGPNGEEAKGDEPLLEFVAQQWESALKPCIDEIIRVDKDDESYIAKLREPFVTRFENSLFDGTYVGVGILDWLLHIQSPVTYGLEDRIRKL